MSTPGWWGGVAVGALLNYALDGRPGTLLATIILGVALAVLVDDACTGRW